MCGPLSSSAKKRLFFRRRGAVTTTFWTSFITYLCCILALCVAAAAIAPALSVSSPAHASWIPGPVSGFLSSTWGLTVVIAAFCIALAKLMPLFLARRAAHANWSSSCLPTTMQPKNGTGVAYQRLDTNSFISSFSTKQSSSSEPADGTVYITIDAPTCPDMMKQQPNTDSTTDIEASTGTEAATDNTAVTSSDLSSLSRQQLLLYIAQLQDSNSTKDATIVNLNSKADTLQELLGIRISGAGRVKMVAAQLDARRQQAGPAHENEAVREQQQQEREDVISKSGKLLLEYGSLCGRLHCRDWESISKRAELQQQATKMLARMHFSGAAVTAQYYFMLNETGNKKRPARMNTPKSRLSA